MAAFTRVPILYNHGASASHSSIQEDGSTKSYIDFNIINCYYHKITQKAMMIASDWIRPEDIKHYDDLCEKTGNHRLVIKLVERTKSTAFLNRVVDSYLAEHYDGNLLDLFNWIGNDQASTSAVNVSGYIEKIKSGEISMDGFRKYSSFFMIPKMYIDNRKLDGFLNHFIHQYECDKRLCWLSDDTPLERGNEYCYYTVDICWPHRSRFPFSVKSASAMDISKTILLEASSLFSVRSAARWRQICYHLSCFGF